MDDNLTLCLPRPSSGLNPHEPVLLYTAKPANIPASHILIQVDRFGFSANNITYQALGETPHFRYFDFHPAPEAEDISARTHGLVPVWGFGTVVESKHPKIDVGERVYGYLAPARYLMVPISHKDVNKHSFYVPRPHLPADRRPYNQIIRCKSDPQYRASLEDLTMLYRPLFWTSYWCEDWLHSTNYRGGANKILISSASSKTAFCLAYLVNKRNRKDGKHRTIVGLTSKGNIEFTRGLGLYNEVVDYNSFASHPAMASMESDKWIYLDVAGNEDINKQVFAHFKGTDLLVASISLGMTNLSPSAPEASSKHWSTNTFTESNIAATSTSPLPTLTPHTQPLEQFFMPEWLNVRKHQLPINEIFARQHEAWSDLMRDCVGWVKLESVYGEKAVQKAYQDMRDRKVRPDQGFIWSLWDGPEKSKL